MKQGFWKWYFQVLKPRRIKLGFPIILEAFMGSAIMGCAISFLLIGASKLLIIAIPLGVTMVFHSYWRHVANEEQSDWRKGEQK